jgi:hypothetical protein
MAPRYCRASTFGNDQASYKGLTIVNGMGKQTGMSDGSGQTAWSYNAIGSVLTERRTILGGTGTISYNYNPDGSPDGSPASLAYPSNRTVTYTISNAQRLTAADDVANNIQFATAVSYAPPGDCKECSVAGGALIVATKLAKVGFGGYALTVTIGLALGVCCTWAMRAACNTVVAHTKRRSESVQEWYFRALYLATMPWIFFSGLLALWVSSAFLRLAF